MTSDDFKGLSDEELERLAFDLEEPKAEEPAVEPAESAPAAPEAPETESELTIEDLAVEDVPEVEDPKAPKTIQQNLTRALQIERDRRREAEAERKQLLEMLQQFQQPQAKAPEPDPVVEETPDPYLDPEAFIDYKLAERDRKYQAEIESLKQANLASKIQASEEDLKRSGELEEYHQLVNLSDANHPFAKMVSQTPNLLDKILAHPRPAQYALEIARNQRMADPEFAKSRVEELREQIRKEEEAKALKKVQAILAKKAPNALGPKGVASLSSSTGGNSGVAKDIRSMSNAELEAAAYADY